MRFGFGRNWLRGLLWALAAAAWIAVLSLPVLGLLLAVRGE